MTSPGGFVAKSTALVVKDLKIEARARSTLPPVLAFALAVTLLLAFTISGRAVNTGVDLPFIAGAVALPLVLAGYLWVTILFAGLIAFSRSFELESEDSALESLLLAPIDRSALYVSKAIANLASLVVVELVVLPAFAVFFGLDLGARWTALVLVVVLVDIGFVAIGTLFAGLAAQTRSRELMLPILSLPALVPLFIAGVELTSDIVGGGNLTTVAGRGWFGIVLAFDAIFAIVGALCYEFVLD